MRQENGLWKHEYLKSRFIMRCVYEQVLKLIATWYGVTSPAISRLSDNG